MSISEKIYDIVCIGFGPAGIALAAALEDIREETGAIPCTSLFLEKAPSPAWQPGMLIRDTDIQHHYFRDLATPRNPRSRFTFANYLKVHNRLFDFGELVMGASGGAVSRLEWSDYISWVAKELDDYVLYDQEVLNVKASNTAPAHFVVTTPRGQYAAKNVVVASGRIPYTPKELEGLPNDRVFHSSSFLYHEQDIKNSKPGKIAVIGSGQNAAEILLHLHSNTPPQIIFVSSRSWFPTCRLVPV